jgi:hypothetical protein
MFMDAGSKNAWNDFQHDHSFYYGQQPVRWTKKEMRDEYYDNIGRPIPTRKPKHKYYYEASGLHPFLQHALDTFRRTGRQNYIRPRGPQILPPNQIQRNSAGNLNSWQQFLHDHKDMGYTREELVRMYRH